jgi:hypothetical protein
MLDPALGDEPTEPDHLEAIIRQSNRQQYEQARELYRLITSRQFANAADLISIDSEPKALRKAFEAASEAIKRDPHWTALVFVLGLVFAQQPGMTITAEDVRGFILNGEERGLNLGPSAMITPKSKK